MEGIQLAIEVTFINDIKKIWRESEKGQVVEHCPKMLAQAAPQHDFVDSSILGVTVLSALHVIGNLTKQSHEHWLRTEDILAGTVERPSGIWQFAKEVH